MKLPLEKFDRGEFSSAAEVSLFLSWSEFTHTLSTCFYPVNKPTNQYFWELSLSSFIHAYLEVITQMKILPVLFLLLVYYEGKEV